MLPSPVPPSPIVVTLSPFFATALNSISAIFSSLWSLLPIVPAFPYGGGAGKGPPSIQSKDH
jgi:hypothetical protein